MLNADFVSGADQIGAEQCLFPCPGLGSCNTPLGRWFTSPAGMARQAGKRLGKPRYQRSGPGEASAAVQLPQAPGSSFSGSSLSFLWMRPGEPTSPWLRLDIRDLVTAFVTVGYVLAFLPCLRFPLSLGSVLGCRSLEGAAWSPARLGEGSFGEGFAGGFGGVKRQSSGLLSS